MSKKPISQKRAEREKAEERVLNRVFVVFLLGLVAECYLFILYRAAVGTVDSMIASYYIAYWSGWVGLAMLAAGAVGGWIKREDRKIRVIMTWVGGVGLFLGISGWIISMFFNDCAGIILMCVLVPIAAVLGLIFLLYQHECFFSTLAISGALFAVWVRGTAASSESWNMPVIAGALLGAVILAAAAFLVRKAQQEGGKLLGFRVFSLECDYRVVFGVLAIALACVLLAVVFPAITYYLIWVLGVLVFAELVYYTTKLM